MKSIRNLDTQDNRDYWDSVDRAAAEVKAHTLCFPNWCIVEGCYEPCPKSIHSETCHGWYGNPPKMDKNLCDCGGAK